MLAFILGLLLWLFSAQELGPEVIEVAVEAQLDAVELAGASNTTGLPPRTYAVMVGHLAPTARAVGGTVWDRLATQCEARGWANPWVAVSPGGTYRGGLQMDAVFWRRYGGLAFAPRPDLASREQQIAVAERGQAVQGWLAWPVCSRRLGLR